MSELTQVATPTNQPTNDLVPKTEVTKVQNQLQETTKSLDAMRNQLLDPSYLEFLESKKIAPVARTNTPTNLNLANMSIDDLRKVIAEQTAEAVKNVVSPLFVRINDIQAKQELDDVKSRYPDFADYQDKVVAILDANPKSDITIEQALLIAKGGSQKEAPAKTEVKDLKIPTSVEKPGTTVPLSGDTLKTFKNGAEAGNAAWKEVAAKHGLQGDTI